LAFVEELLEDPPNAFHEGEVHGLVVIVKIDPPPKPLNDHTPLPGVSLDNTSALLIVLVYAHLQNVRSALEPQLLVNFILNRKPMTIPTKPPLDMVTSLVSIASHNILDGSSQDVPVVRQARGERWPIVENVGLLPFRPLHCLRESLDVSPIEQCFLLLIWEAWPLWHIEEGGGVLHPRKGESWQWVARS